MDDVACNFSRIIGRNFGQGTPMFLEPFLLFKGSLRAAQWNNTEKMQWSQLLTMEAYP